MDLEAVNLQCALIAGLEPVMRGSLIEDAIIQVSVGIQVIMLLSETPDGVCATCADIREEHQMVTDQVILDQAHPLREDLLWGN